MDAPSVNSYLAPVIIHLFALLTGVCRSRSAVYIVLLDLYLQKCCHSDNHILHTTTQGVLTTANNSLVDRHVFFRLQLERQ